MSATTLTAVPIGTLGEPMTGSTSNTMLVLNTDPTSGDQSEPSTYPYFVQVDSEVMEVTANTGFDLGDVNPGGFEFSVDRAADGTNVASHNVNETVSWLDGYLPAAHLPAPTGLQPKAVSSTQINLSWNSVVAPAGSAIGASTYVIDQWNPTTQQFQDVAIVPGGTLNYTVPNLNPSTPYYFEVCATNDAGRGDFTNWVTATTFAAAPNPVTAPAPTPVATVPGVPTNFAAQAVSTSQINLSWSGVTGATGYRVYELENGSMNQIATTTGTTYPVMNLSPDTTYTFSVAAYNGTGTGNLAPEQSATTFPLEIVPPTITSAAANSPSSVNLTWTAVPGATSYNVEQVVGGVWKSIGSVGNPYATVTGLPAASTDSFRVAATVGSTTTGYSGSVSVLTWPAAPTNVVPTASGSQMNVSWSAVGGVNGYVVRYQTAGQGTWTQYNVAAGQTSLAIPGLTAGVSYTFEVGASNASGTTYSAPITQSLQAAPPVAPAGLTGSLISSSQARLSWSGVAGATGYEICQYFNGQWNKIAVASGTSIVLNLPVATTYYFDVASINSAGTGNVGQNYVVVTAP